MGEEDDVVMTRAATSKRGRTAEGSQPRGTLASGSNGDPMGNLPATLGEGEYERPLMEAILVALRDLSMDVQDLKGAVYMSWELERDSEYVTEGMKMKEA